MNLYKINVAHFSEGASYDGVHSYILAENDTEVYAWVDKNCNNDNWEDVTREQLAGNFDKIDIYGGDVDDFKLIGTETIKDYVMREQGNLETGDDLEDLYYGHTLFGWEVINENVPIWDAYKLDSYKVANIISENYTKI